MIILVGGFPGSGKTFFAKRLASRLNCHWLSSDRVRKDLKATGKYRIDDKMHNYKALAAVTEQCLLAGESLLVVDATFSHQQMRDLFLSLGKKLQKSVLLIWIYASEDVIRRRLQKPREDSEADYGVYEKIRRQFEPITQPFLSLESTDENIEQMLAKAEHYIKSNEGR